MLKQAPNNNNSTRVEYVLNEAPNRNDAMGIVNNVRLTTIGAMQFFNGSCISSHHTEKPTYQRREIMT